jgi:hypothetical protein
MKASSSVINAVEVIGISFGASEQRLQRAMRRKMRQALFTRPVSSSYVGMIRFKFTGLVETISATIVKLLQLTRGHPGAPRFL